MKFVKIGILALAMGLFVASCGSSETTEETTDTTATTEMAPAAPAPVDTAAAMADTTMHTDTAHH